jgi:hypothetical protein
MRIQILPMDSGHWIDSPFQLDSVAVLLHTHSRCRHQLEVNGQFHAHASVPWGYATLCPQGRKRYGPQGRSEFWGKQNAFI